MNAGYRLTLGAIALYCLFEVMRTGGHIYHHSALVKTSHEYWFLVICGTGLTLMYAGGSAAMAWIAIRPPKDPPR